MATNAPNQRSKQINAHVCTQRFDLGIGVGEWLGAKINAYEHYATCSKQQQQHQQRKIHFKTKNLTNSSNCFSTWSMLLLSLLLLLLFEANIHEQCAQFLKLHGIYIISSKVITVWRWILGTWTVQNSIFEVCVHTKHSNTYNHIGNMLRDASKLKCINYLHFTQFV